MIQEQLKIYLSLGDISIDVYNNATNVLSNLSENILSKITLSNMYAPYYNKTVIIDFEYGDDIFSLEIGKDSIGYFSEIGSVTDAFCEELKMVDCNFKQLNNIIEDFLKKYNI